MQSFKSFLKEIVIVVAMSLIIVLPIRYFVAQPFIVSGQSMDTTFADKQYLIVDQFTYKFIQEPKRGEVIVFRVPQEALALSNYALDKKMYFIKRIIGMPGDTVEVKGNDVTIFNTDNPDGLKLKEDYVYIDKMIPTRDVSLKVTLKSDEYFVMGDNRNNSSDSRFWGPLKRSYITGRPIIRLFPFTKINVFPGYAQFEK
jgi:signal peptidase I